MPNYHQIVKTQREFFGTGALYPVQARKEQLLILKKLVEENKEDLCKVVHEDLKRHSVYSEAAEVGSVLGEIGYFLQHLDEWTKPTKVDNLGPLKEDDEVFIAKDPKGVVLLIAPWNYPIAMCFWPLVPILGAGNTCVIKPSELAPSSSDLVDKLVAKYFDPKIVTVVAGGVQETTALLEERFDHIMYTGSPGIAKIIMTAAAKHLTPVTLELGGKCPVVVEPDANLQETAERITRAKWVNVGQTCITPDYVLTTEEIRPKLAKAIEEALKKIYGNDTKNNALYSRIINERHFDRLATVYDKSNAKVLVKHGDDFDRGDRYMAPHVLEINKDDAFMSDEIFGPFLPIIAIKDFNEALNVIRTFEKPLAAYLFTNDEAKQEKFLEKISAGGVTLNDVQTHISAKKLPFGGVGNSGMGRYNGKYGFDTFTHEKSVVKRKLGKL